MTPSARSVVTICVIVICVTIYVFFEFFEEMTSKALGLRVNTTKNSTIMILDNTIFGYHTCQNSRISLYSTVGFDKNQTEISVIADHKCSHLMTVSYFMGRLGNNMFQAASVIGVATKHGYTPVFAAGSKLANAFELINLIDFKLTNVKNFGEVKCCVFNDKVNELSHKHNWTLSGYLQSWRYFEGAEDRVRKAFTFKENYRDEVRAFMKGVSRTGAVKIGIHVRRGDFLFELNRKLGYVAAPVSYIQRAMAHFHDKYSNVQFIFASNEIKWCKDNFNGTSILFSPFTDDAMDLALLASCDHVIITAGTFGWWAGWLGKGTTVYYRGYPRRGSQLEASFNSTSNYSDYYPKDWIGLD